MQADQILPLATFLASGGLICYVAHRRQRAASDLRIAEQRLRTIANQVPAMIGYWNRGLRCEFANDAYREWFGVAPEQIIGTSMPELLGERLFKLNEPYVKAALDGRAQRFERTLVKPGGARGFVDASYVPDVDETGKVRGFFVLVADVTPLRESFDRVRELAQRIETVREEERRSAALLLHEGVAQDLYAARLALDLVESASNRSASVEQACDDLKNAIVKCMADTRQVANDLRPSALAHLPLSSVLKDHARYFGGLSGLAINVVEVEPFPVLDEATGLLFFRAAQEALTNVVRHAQATRVDIVLHADAARIIMDVADDGIGIADNAMNKPGSLGLLGIRERFGVLGGELIVQRAATAGTTLTVQLPISFAQPVARAARRAGKE